MPDRQIHPLGDEEAPAAYVIPAAAELLLKGAYAKFDGSGAGSAFRPVLRIISDSGTVSLEAPADSIVAAGESATASWFPHVGGGGNIRFDAENVGDWLDIEVTGASPVSFNAFYVNDTGGNGIGFQTTGGFFVTSETGTTIQDFGGGNVSLISQAAIIASALADLTLGSNGTTELTAIEGVDIVSNAAQSIAPFPVSFGVNSVQIAAGDATNYGTVVLEAFDRQGTPAYTEYFVGAVDFNPNPYAYNGQTAQILGGQTFTVVASDGSPLFQVLALEQGGTTHIKSGTTIHADL